MPGQITEIAEFTMEADFWNFTNKRSWSKNKRKNTSIKCKVCILGVHLQHENSDKLEISSLSLFFICLQVNIPYILYSKVRLNPLD
jgi:hypothetical protein